MKRVFDMVLHGSQGDVRFCEVSLGLALRGWSLLGMERQSGQRGVRRGLVLHGEARSGSAVLAGSVLVMRGRAGYGVLCCGKSAMVCHVMASPGEASCATLGNGVAVEVWCATVSTGTFWHG